LYLGWVPQVGQDDHYPQDRQGTPLPPIKFTIRAEKCPNRRGVEEILKHFQGEALGFDQLLAAVGAGEIEALYLTAGYSPRLGAWLDQNQLDMLKRLRLLVIQDLFPPASLARAKFALPASTFAEKDGCFVNQANLAQAIHWAVRPGGFGRTDGQIFLDLLQRRGLLHAESLRLELAREVPFFAPLGDGVIDERGVRLG
jgi:NADH-quinone oxidoreductase subunit G